MSAIKPRVAFLFFVIGLAISHYPSAFAAAFSLPTLSARLLVDDSVRIAWPDSAAGFQLEAATSPAGAFEAVYVHPVRAAGQFTLLFPPDGARRFFRLRFIGPVHLEGSSPANGEGAVAVTRETIFRFSAPLGSSVILGPGNFYAEANGRRILASAQLSKDRRTATLFYQEPLPGSARVLVTFVGDGMFDDSGVEADVDGDGQPGGRVRISFDTLGLLPVPGTSVFGRVFASELMAGADGSHSINRPLGGVTITVDGAEQELRTITDADGNFQLEPVPAGEFFVHIDGRTSPQSDYPHGAYYPAVGKRWSSIAGRATAAPGGGEIYLPLIGPGTLQTVSMTSPTVVTFPSEVIAANPSLAGVSITVPANALFSDNGNRGGRVGIAPVPPDRLPSPLPAGLNFPLVITVQTDGAQNFDQPAPVCFPNLPDPVTGLKLAPGEKTALWSFNHDLGNWEIIGPATISADGNFACSDVGVGIRQPGWHGVSRGTQGSTGGGGAASATPPSPCDWEALRKFFNDRYEAQKDTANGVLAYQLKCLAEKACLNQNTWGGGFIKSVMCAEKMNPNGAQPGFFPGLSIFPIGQALDFACRNTPVPETGDPVVDANIKLYLNELCAPLAGFAHHFINELLPYFAIFCDQLNDADHDALFAEGVIPCFRDQVTDTRLNDVLEAIGEAIVPPLAAVLREVAQASCLLGPNSVSLAADPPPLPPPPGRDALFVTKLADLGTLRVTTAPGDDYFLQVGQTYALSARLSQPDGSSAELAADPATKYQVFGDTNFLELLPGAQMKVLGTPSPISSLVTPIYVLALNGTNFGIGQFALQDRDTDGDGIVDSAELRLGLNPLVSNVGMDSDGDQVSDLKEALMGTNPLAFDTDGDGIEDGRELRFGMNPRDPSLASAPREATLQLYLLEDLDTGVLQRGVTSSQGVLQELILASARHYRLTLLVPSTLFLGAVEFTSAAPGLVTLIPRVVVVPPEGPDTDQDGLTDEAERVVGSDPRVADTDGDGVNDAAEVMQGTNPTGVDQPRNGILYAVPLFSGNPLDVSAVGDAVVVAQGGGGVSVLNTFRGMAPTVIAHVQTTGPALSVAAADGYVGVAQGGAGFSYFRLNELPELTAAHHTRLPGRAVAVAVAANLAYVGLASGRVVVVDMATGVIVADAQTLGDLQDLALAGDYLYALSSQGLTTISIFEGGFAVVSQTFHGFTVGAGQVRLRVHAGGNRLIANTTFGYVVFGLENPAQPVQLDQRVYAQFGFRQIVPDGFGIGLGIVGSSSLQDTPHDIWTYDLSDTAPPDNLRQILTFGRQTRAATLWGALGYVIDDTDRLFVVKYRDYDARRIPPSIRLETSFNSLGASERRLGRVTAVVSDDVAVRQVDFFVNGRLALTDGSFPFEHRFIVPGRESGRSNLVLRARAQDTAGNVSWSEELNIPVVEDATAPNLRLVRPEPGAVIAQPFFSGITAVFDDPIDVLTLTADAFQVISAGADGQFGTADDQRARGGQLSLLPDEHTVALTFSPALVTGRYRISVADSLRNRAGLKLSASFVSEFVLKPEVAWIRDGDGQWDDPENWSTGAVPGPNDAVVIDRPGIELTVTVGGGVSIVSQVEALKCEETLVIDSFRTLELAQASSIRHLRLTGGRLDGVGDLSILEQLNWESGTIAGAGLLAIEPGAEFRAVGAGQRLYQARPMDLAGHALINAALQQAGGRWNIRSGAELEFTDDAALLFAPIFGNQPLEIANAGTVRKTGSQTLDLTQITFSNDGLFQADAGSVLIGVGRTGGEIRTAPGVSVAINAPGEHVLLAIARFTGSEPIELRSGYYNVPGDLRCQSLRFSGGRFTGAGRVIVEGFLEWNRGEIACVGGLSVLDGARVDVTSQSVLYGFGAALDGALLENAGTVRLSGQMFALNGARIENRGLFELLGDFGVTDPTGSGGGQTLAAAAGLQMAIPGAPPQFNNAGVLRKTLGTGESVFQRIMVSSSGLVDLRMGILAVKAAHGGGGQALAAGAFGAPGLAAAGESSFEQAASGVLSVTATGSSPGDGFALLRVEEAASFRGTLRFSIAPGFVPVAGQTFRIIEYGSATGDFGDFQVVGDRPAGLVLERVTEATSMRVDAK